MGDAISVIVIVVVLLLLIALPAVTTIWVKRKLQRWLIRKAEERALRRSWESAAHSADMRRLSSYFIIANTVGLLVIMALAISAKAMSGVLKGVRQWIGTPDVLSLSMASSLAQIPAALLIPAILYLHYSGVGSRKLKYEFVLTAFYIALFPSIYVYSGLETWAVAWQPGTPIGIVIGLLFWWLIFLMAQFGIGWISNRIEVDGRFRSWFYRFQSRLWWVLAVSYLPFTGIYIILRFHFINLASRRPILYFRSFSLKSGDIAFGKIVAKAARRYGIIEGLISDSQRSSDLQISLEVTDQGRFTAANDVVWRDWVVDRLSVAVLVVVDMTEATDSVNWETVQSISSLGPARVGIIYRGDEPPIPENVWRLKYELSRRGVKRARKELERWFRERIP